MFPRRVLSTALIISLLALANFTQILARQEILKVAINIGASEIDNTDPTGTFSGPDIDLVEAIVSAAGYRIEWIDLGNTTLDDNFLTSGQVDVAILLSSSRPNSKEFLLTKPFFDVDAFTYCDGVCPSIMSNIRWGYVGSGDTSNPNNVYYKTTEDAFKGLFSGDVRAISVNGLAARWLFGKNPDFEKRVARNTAIGVDQLRWMVVSSKNQELLDKLDVSFASIQKNDEYGKIFKKWVGQDVPDNYFVHMNFFDTIQREVEPALSAPLFTLLTTDLAKKDVFEKALKALDETAMPALKALEVPKTAPAEATYNALQAWASAVYNAIKFVVEGGGFGGLQTLLSARSVYMRALYSMISVS